MKPEVLAEMEHLVQTKPVDLRQELAVAAILAELQRALRWPPMNSAHEGYAVLDEEVDELWDHVKVKQGERNLPEMAYEAVQVAAMALRFIIDVCQPKVAAK